LLQVFRDLVVFSIDVGGNLYSLVDQPSGYRHLVLEKQVIDCFNEVLPSFCCSAPDLLDGNIGLSYISVYHRTGRFV
tara:strand:+ start:4638 stop:4868 length:231 start_codon:yes stop_codon:yes gene_type:complete